MVLLFADNFFGDLTI